LLDHIDARALTAGIQSNERHGRSLKDHRQCVPKYQLDRKSTRRPIVLFLGCARAVVLPFAGAAIQHAEGAVEIGA
jgi:flavin-dependent dehydrogenase